MPRARSRSLRPGLCGGQVRKGAVEAVEPADRCGAVARGDRGHRRLSSAPSAEAVRDAAQANDLTADRQRRRQPRGLQRVDRVRERGEPAVDPALPCRRGGRQFCHA